MQSSERSNPSATSCSKVSDNMEVIAQQIGSRKRRHSEMTENVKDRPEISKESKEIRFSFDIIKCFPGIICECVFQHLDVKELLEASKVTSGWNSFIGERPQVGKLKLIFSGKNHKHELTDEAMNILKNSARKYQNIEFETTSSRRLEFVLSFLKKRTGSWKSVILKTLANHRQDFLPKILAIIEPSVESLSIFFDAMFLFMKKVNNYSKWTFKQLKSLEYFNSLFHGQLDHNIFKYFKRCTSLVKFYWRSLLPNGESKSMMESLRILLLSNHGLKELDIAECEEFFACSPDFKFKLRKLKVSIKNDSPPETNYLRSFLETQAQTLESLDMSVLYTRACLDLILGSMPRLTTFTADYWHIAGTQTNWRQELPVNTTINYLELLVLCNFEISNPYQSLIKALPSLKHFKATEINYEMLFALAQHAPVLESIETVWFNVSRLPEGEVFGKIKKFKAQNFEADMQEPTGENEFAKLVKNGMREN